MSKRLTALCGVILAVALAAPASAQIIIGGEPVTTAPGEPAPVALTFPVNTDAAGYSPISIAAPSFSGASEAEAALAAKIAEVVRSDLASIGIFAAPDSRQHLHLHRRHRRPTHMVRLERRQCRRTGRRQGHHRR